MERLNEIMTKEYLAKLDRLVLSMQGKLQQQGYSGARKSNAKGSSLEFSDYREYTAGDDLRRVDWNSYGRFERLYLKLFMEEKQAVISIFLDSSASMGEEEKFVYAKAVAASLAYISLQNMDKVNLMTWSEGILEKKQNIQSKNRFLEMMQFLQGVRGSGKTSFSKTISEFCANTSERGISIIISDFLTEEKWEEAIQKLQYHKQEVLLIWILSEDEREPSWRGNLRLKDTETGEYQDLEMTQGMLDAYQKELAKYEAKIREFCRKRQIRMFQISEKDSLLKTIHKIL